LDFFDEAYFKSLQDLYRDGDQSPLEPIPDMNMLPPVTVTAQVLRKPSVGVRILNWGQTGLDVAGLVPGYGEVADGVNALIYLARGDKGNAALSGLAMVPIFGWSATGGKLGIKGAKAIGKAGKGAVKTLQTGGHTLQPRTLKALGLTQKQGYDAIHALKNANNIPKDAHMKIMSDGSIIHPHTGKNYGSLFDYLP
jgi:hypothetical protein